MRQKEFNEKGCLGHSADISYSTKLRSIKYGEATLKVKGFLNFKAANSMDCIIGATFNSFK